MLAARGRARAKFELFHASPLPSGNFHTRRFRRSQRKYAEEATALVLVSSSQSFSISFARVATSSSFSLWLSNKTRAQINAEKFSLSSLLRASPTEARSGEIISKERRAPSTLKRSKKVTEEGLNYSLISVREATKIEREDVVQRTSKKAAIRNPPIGYPRGREKTTTGNEIFWRRFSRLPATKGNHGARQRRGAISSSRGISFVHAIRLFTQKNRQWKGRN